MVGQNGENGTLHTYPSSRRHSHILAAILPTWLRRQTGGRLLATWLLPSFVHDRVPTKARREGVGGSILPLDGLRGLCCLAVMNMHWTFAVTDSNEGGSASINTDYLFHRPFWYLLWAGTSHVNVFFVMSGYVLSARCFRNIHRGMPVNSAITSAVFRRATRIFLPPVVLLLIYLLAIQLGVFNYANVVFQQQNQRRIYQLCMFETPPPVLPAFAAQLWDVLGAIIHLVDPNVQFDLPNYGKYDTHLWTMPTEYYCSIALYAVLTATCQLQTPYRFLCHTLLVLYCWLGSHQTYTLFFAGMTIADFDVLWKQRIQPDFCTSSRPPISNYLAPTNLISITSTVVGLYLLSMPLLWAEDTPSYSTILACMPDYMTGAQQVDALRAIGALLVVWPISFNATVHDANSPIICFLLANPISVYLGKISFALYLVHGFVIRSLGYAILPTIYLAVVRDQERRVALGAQAVEDESGSLTQFAAAAEKLTAWEIGHIWVLGYSIVLPVTIWLADIFWRAVDLRCVQLGLWMEGKMKVDMRLRE